MSAPPPLPPNLPPVPYWAQPAPCVRGLVLAAGLFFAYSVLLSDNGLLLALFRGLREMDAHVWARRVKIPLTLGAAALPVLVDFVRCLRGRACWGEWCFTCACCGYVFVQVMVLNMLDLI